VYKFAVRKAKQLGPSNISPFCQAVRGSPAFATAVEAIKANPNTDTYYFLNIASLKDET